MTKPAEEIFKDGAIRPADMNAMSHLKIDWYVAAQMINRQHWELKRAVNGTNDQRVSLVDGLSKELAALRYELNHTQRMTSEYYALRMKSSMHIESLEADVNALNVENDALRQENVKLTKVADENFNLKIRVCRLLIETEAQAKRIAELEALLAVRDSVSNSAIRRVRPSDL